VAVIGRNDDVHEEDNGNAGDMKLFDCEPAQSDGGHWGRALTSSGRNGCLHIQTEHLETLDDSQSDIFIQIDEENS
jgi:hypothetical protein